MPSKETSKLVQQIEERFEELLGDYDKNQRSPSQEFYIARSHLDGSAVPLCKVELWAQEMSATPRYVTVDRAEWMLRFEIHPMHIHLKSEHNRSKSASLRADKTSSLFLRLTGHPAPARMVPLDLHLFDLPRAPAPETSKRLESIEQLVMAVIIKGREAREQMAVEVEEMAEQALQAQIIRSTQWRREAHSEALAMTTVMLAMRRGADMSQPPPLVRLDEEAWYKTYPQAQDEQASAPATTDDTPKEQDEP